jgi:hypothetical protein
VPYKTTLQSSSISPQAAIRKKPNIAEDDVIKVFISGVSLVSQLGDMGSTHIIYHRQPGVTKATWLLMEMF